MVLWTQIICVSRCHALKINYIASLISSSNSFYLYAACDLNLSPLAIYNFIHLDVHFLTHLLHHGVELFIRLDSLLIIHGSIFCKASQIGIVQDAWYYTLCNNSVSTVVHNRCGQIVQIINLEALEGAQACHIVVRLSPTRVTLCSGEIFETVHNIYGITEENIVIDKYLLVLSLIGI